MGGVSTSQADTQAAAPTPGQRRAPPDGDYFEGAPAVGKAIADRFSADAELLELRLYSNHATFTLRDPHKRTYVDRYTLRSAGFDGPDAVSLSGPEKSHLDEATFRLSEIDLTLVSKLVADAKQRIVIEHSFANVLIEKDLFRRALGFRVYISSERDGSGARHPLAWIDDGEQRAAGAVARAAICRISTACGTSSFADPSARACAAPRSKARGPVR
jgi:hypothetical protein